MVDTRADMADSGWGRADWDLSEHVDRFAAFDELLERTVGQFSGEPPVRAAAEDTDGWPSEVAARLTPVAGGARP